MPRPSKFTAERRERFLVALRAGVFPETAARHAGWSPATLYRILRATTPTHVAFRDEVRRVETELELRLTATVTQAASRDPRLALALLERRFAERWGRRAALVARPAEASLPDAQGREGIVVLEPGLIEALVPRLLEARVGPAGSSEALRRVERFALPVGPEEDE